MIRYSVSVSVCVMLKCNIAEDQRIVVFVIIMLTQLSPQSYNQSIIFVAGLMSGAHCQEIT